MIPSNDLTSTRFLHKLFFFSEISNDIKILSRSKVPKNRGLNDNWPFILVNCHLGPEKIFFCQGVDLLLGRVTSDTHSNDLIWSPCYGVRITSTPKQVFKNQTRDHCWHKAVQQWSLAQQLSVWHLLKNLRVKLKKPKTYIVHFDWKKNREVSIFLTVNYIASKI